MAPDPEHGGSQPLKIETTNSSTSRKSKKNSSVTINNGMKQQPSRSMSAGDSPLQIHPNHE